MWCASSSKYGTLKENTSPHGWEDNERIPLVTWAEGSFTHCKRWSPTNFSPIWHSWQCSVAPSSTPWRGFGWVQGLQAGGRTSSVVWVAFHLQSHVMQPLVKSRSSSIHEHGNLVPSHLSYDPTPSSPHELLDHLNTFYSTNKTHAQEGYNKYLVYIRIDNLT